MGFNFLWIILVVCAVLSAVGFYKMVYFLSLGYGFAIAGGGITVLIISIVNGFTGNMLLLAIFQCILFVLYGARLSGFLLIRELKSASYRKVLKNDTDGEKKIPIFVSVAIWVSVAVLYTAQVSPMFFRYLNRSTDVIVPVIGMVISVLGLLLETVSDLQKSAQKKENPNQVAMKGLYKIVRCPNYFGEILFWTGIFVSGITTYQNVPQWITAVLAYICIVFIMFNGAQRLEKRQMKRYGNDEAYHAYADHTPIIIPLLPIYHLNKKQ